MLLLLLRLLWCNFGTANFYFSRKWLRFSQNVSRSQNGMHTNTHIQTLNTCARFARSICLGISIQNCFVRLFPLTPVAQVASVFTPHANAKMKIPKIMAPEQTWDSGGKMLNSLRAVAKNKWNEEEGGRKEKPKRKLTPQPVEENRVSKTHTRSAYVGQRQIWNEGKQNERINNNSKFIEGNAMSTAKPVCGSTPMRV